MKKFQFSLETILGYRQQVLEAAQLEYGQAEALVVEQQNVIEKAETDRDNFNAEYCQKKEEGITAADALGYQGCLNVLEKEIAMHHRRLMMLRDKAEIKRQAVVSAKVDTSSTEKLREKKLAEYNHEALKAEEALIDELVAATWSAQSRNA
ncbi:MAG: flagellar export protein FliJ [Eubacteriales bacterium]